MVHTRSAETNDYPNPLKHKKKKASTTCFYTFQSIQVTLRTTMFNIQKLYIMITWNLCVLYGSRNKQQILTYKTIKDKFL